MTLTYNQYSEMGGGHLKNLNKEPMKGWIKKFNIKPSTLSGHLTLNGAPLAVHRRAGFMVNIGGMSSSWRGLEIYGWTQRNNYGRFCKNGSVVVLANGKPLDLKQSGWNTDGWHWSHIPGATTSIMPSHEMFDGYAFYGNGSNTAGGTNMSDNGIWGMDFTGGNGPAFRKSVFCFDDKVSVITSGIHNGANYPAVTTLFQNALSDGFDTIQIDDRNVVKLGSETTINAESPRWLIDNQGQGYLIPSGQNNLKVAARSQEWTYMTKQYLIDESKNPFPNSKAYQDFRYHKKKLNVAELEKSYTPTKGNFGIAWFDHGSAPKDASCAYTIVVKADAERMKKLAQSESKELEILAKDGNFHAIRDIPTSTIGYVFFAAEHSIENAGHVSASSQPCF